jgi:hypothetical protein
MDRADHAHVRSRLIGEGVGTQYYGIFAPCGSCWELQKRDSFRVLSSI